MPSITAFAIHHSRLTILSLVLIAVTGIAVFLEYPSREDPSIVIRNASVTVQFPGMSPDRVEDLITRPLEEKIREIPEVKTIDSDSKTGLSLVNITLHDSVSDLDPVWQDLRQKMDDVAPGLPKGSIGPNVNDQVGLTAIASIALWSEGFTMAEMNDTAKDLRNALYALDGVNKIEMFGVQDERVYLEVSQAAISQYGIDPNLIVNSLNKQNIIMPGGEIDANGQTVILEPSGNFSSLEDIEDVLIAIPGTDRLASLKDIVSVRRDYVDPPRAPVYFNGKQAIVLSISIADGINSVAFGETLKAKVIDLQNGLAWGYVLDYATFQPALVDAAVASAVNNLYQTLVIVLVVVMAFLGFRTGLIVGAFVPFTMLMGLVIMRLMEVELQRVSISAMIIALGMLVDNGIVIAEDVRVRMEAGVDRFKAAIASGQSLAIPLLTSSLTTILFFMPMALAEGGAGEFTGSLAVVVTIVLLSSWFLAMYMTPTISAWFMKVKPSAEDAGHRFDGAFYQRYRGLLELVLRRPLIFLVTMMVLLVGSIQALKLVDNEFFPLGDRNQYLVYLDLPAGSSVKQTDAVVGRFNDWINDPTINPEVSSSVAYVANGGPRFYLALSQPDPDPHRSFILINLHDAATADAMVVRSQSWIYDNLPEARGEVKKMWMGASEPGLFEIELRGPDDRVLQDTGNALVAELNQMDGMLVAKQDWENPVLKLQVNVDQVKARAAGVTSEEIANALNTYLSGSSVTDYREGDTVIPVVIRGVDEERGTLTGLQALSIWSQSLGTWIPLVQVADFDGVWQPGRIRRENQQRTLTVSAKHGNLGAVDVLAYMQPVLDKLEVPAGHSWEIAGEIADQAEANGNLFSTLPYCVGLIIVLLVWQFNSFRRPAIILLTIPLLMIGAVAGMLIMQAKFGFMVMLGLFSLAGIIINNGIVLIDRIDSEREDGLSVRDAIIQASLSRLRPILITTLTTVLGLLPLIISQDPLFYAMACAIAFGLSVATLLTLGVVPALYALFFRRADRQMKEQSV